MTEYERKRVSRAKAKIRAGDRAGAIVELEAMLARPRFDMFQAPDQLVLAFATFRCERLGTEGMPAHVCVTRQRVTDVQRTQQTSRGQGSDYPHCDSRSCEQGRRIREALDPAGLIRWRGAGPGGRFERPVKDAAAQAAAKARMAKVGLLEDAPTIDSALRSDSGGGAVEE